MGRKGKPPLFFDVDLTNMRPRSGRFSVTLSTIPLATAFGPGSMGSRDMPGHNASKTGRRSRVVGVHRSVCSAAAWGTPLREAFHHVDPIEAHVVEEERVQQVAIVGEGTDLLRRGYGKIVRIHTVGRDDNPLLDLIGIGPKPQVHGQLEGAQVGAIPHRNECV